MYILFFFLHQRCCSLVFVDSFVCRMARHLKSNLESGEAVKCKMIDCGFTTTTTPKLFYLDTDVRSKIVHASGNEVSGLLLLLLFLLLLYDVE